MAPPKWKTELVPSHKFEFIHIPDFHSDSIWAHLRYSWVWIMFFKSILILCGDIWTCTILIISGSWTSEIKPTIDLSIARWVFSACILLSFVLLAFDFLKANRVIKSQDVSYAVSNQIVSGVYCLQKFDYFCFIEKIRNSSKLHDKLSFFVFFQLKGWKHLVVQAPRQVINILTLIAFMKAIGFDFKHLDDIGLIMPNLKNADKITFCVMVFTSLMFILSGITTLIAVMLWVPLVAKVQGNLKEYVCHKMDKRIDAIIKKTTRERAKKTRMMEEIQERNMGESHHGGGDNSGGGSGSGENSGPAGSIGSGRLAMSPLFKKSPHLVTSPRRPKPTLPDIDVILANTSEDIRLPARAHHTRQSPAQQHREVYHLPPLPNHNLPYHVQHSQFQHHQQPSYPARNNSPYNNLNNDSSNHSVTQQVSQKSFKSNSVPSLAQYGSSHSLHYTQSQHSDYPLPSPPLNTRNLPPHRQASMNSAASYRTDESSPILYPQSIGRSFSPSGGASQIAKGEGRNMSNQHQAARFYTQQQQFQQIYQQRQRQQRERHESGPNSPLQPVESQHYHDSNPHATAILGPAAGAFSPRIHPSQLTENCSSNYGFTTEESLSETPTTPEHFATCRPDSGVLPDTMDPYYIRMTAAGGNSHVGGSRRNGGGLNNVNEVENNDDNEYSPQENLRQGEYLHENEDLTMSTTEARMMASMISMMSRRGSNSSSLLGKNNKIYQPDKTELEHYDLLYKETVADAHLLVKSNQSMSVRSKSSRTSFRSVSPGPSYVMAARKQHQSQTDQETSSVRPSWHVSTQPIMIPFSTSAQDQELDSNDHKKPPTLSYPPPPRDNSQFSHLPNPYNDPDRPLSVLDPPSALFMGHRRSPSNSSIASSGSVVTSSGSLSSPTSSRGHPYSGLPTAIDPMVITHSNSSSSSLQTTDKPFLQQHNNVGHQIHHHRNGSTTLSLAGSSTNSSPRVSMDQFRTLSSPRVSTDQLRTLSTTTLQYLRPYSPRQSSEFTRPYPTPPLPSVPLHQHQHEGKMELNEEECKRSAAIAVAVSAAETGGSLRIEDVLQDLISPSDRFKMTSTPPATAAPYSQYHQQHHAFSQSRPCSPMVRMKRDQEGDYFFPDREDSSVKVEVVTSSSIKVEVDSCSQSIRESATAVSTLEASSSTRVLPPPPPLPSLPMPAFHSRPSSPPLPSLPLDPSTTTTTTTTTTTAITDGGDSINNHDSSSSSSSMIQSFKEEEEEEEEEDENEWEEEKLGTTTRLMARKSTILHRDGLFEPELPTTTSHYADFSRSNSPELPHGYSSSRMPETTTIDLSAPISIAKLASTLRASMETDR